MNENTLLIMIKSSKRPFILYENLCAKNKQIANRMVMDRKLQLRKVGNVLYIGHLLH